MIDSLPPEQTSKKGNLDSHLLLRQYIFGLMARVMEIKSVNPKLEQNQIAKLLSCPSSTLQP